MGHTLRVPHLITASRTGFPVSCDHKRSHQELRSLWDESPDTVAVDYPTPAGTSARTDEQPDRRSMCGMRDMGIHS